MSCFYRYPDHCAVTIFILRLSLQGSVKASEASAGLESTEVSIEPINEYVCTGDDIFVRISQGNEQGVQELIAADSAVVHAKGPVSCHLPAMAYILSSMSILT